MKTQNAAKANRPAVRTGEIARRAGRTTNCIRWWVRRLGLDVRRDPSGHRAFTEAQAAAILAAIAQAAPRMGGRLGGDDGE
jgi:DNA-binding transcriptional MerR regulator